ncbi:MAG: flagellar M-ring protein FliF C-terminal domain-containing protein [Aureliella sp.]
MGALENYLKQIRDLMMTMTPSARIMAGLMAGTIIVSLGWIVSTQQSSQSEYVLGGQSFSDEQLNKMERALGEAGLRQYERQGNRLKIPTHERDLYVKALAEGNAMPNEFNSDVKAVFDSAKNPLIAPSIVKAQLEQAKKDDFSRLLENMPGIRRAKVEHDKVDARFGRDGHQSASIYLFGYANEPIPDSLMQRICRVATTHFPGLKEENITVFDGGTGNCYVGSSDPLSAEQLPFLRAQQRYEQFYENKVREELSVYGDVKIGVIVELDPTLKREMEQLKFDPVGTASTANNSTKSTKSSKASPGGRPGAEPNAAFANKSASLSSPADQNAETKESQESLQNVIGHEATVTKEAPLTPKRVSVTVGVPESYYRKVHAQRFLQANTDPKITEKDIPALTPVDLAKLQKEAEDNIRSAIEGQLPQVRQGDDRFQLVKVYHYPDLPLPEMPEPTLAETTMAWLAKSWSTVGLFVLVGAALLLMFSWVRSPGTAEVDKEFAQGFGLEVPESMGDSLDLGSDEPDAAESAAPEPSTFQVSGGEIKDELSSLIKQNPDAAVNLLRSWIGEAA